ncbi:MAG TPA: diguanylate cyclase [Labilithrix sp.]
MNSAPALFREATEPSSDAAEEVVMVVGDLGRAGRRLARALEPAGYVVQREASIGALSLEATRTPVAVVLECGAGRDPFRAVRWMREQPRYAHVLVVVYASLGELAIGDAVAAGADDLIDGPAMGADVVERIASRIARARMLDDRALFDCVAHVHNRRFVAERFTTLIARGLARDGTCAFGAIFVRDWPGDREELGWRAAERAFEELAFETCARMRPSDVAARFSDDVLLVLLPGLRSADAAARFATRRERSALSCERVFVEAPQDGVTWQDLFDCASRGRRVERERS